MIKRKKASVASTAVRGSQTSLSYALLCLYLSAVQNASAMQNRLFFSLVFSFPFLIKVSMVYWIDVVAVVSR